MTKTENSLTAVETGKHLLNLVLRSCFVLNRKDTRRKVTRTWWVNSGGPGRGRYELEIKAVDRLPWFRDAEVLMMCITKAHREQTQILYFHEHELLRWLGLTRGAENYKGIRASFERLIGVTLKGSYWSDGDNGRGWYTLNKWIHLLELVELETEKSTLGGGDEHVTGLRVILGRWIWEQIQLGHLLTINLDEYKQLDGDGTRALYLYVSAIKSKTWEVDIYQLAETHLGMSHYEYPAHVWKKLKPILEAGKQQGVIAEYERIKRGKYTRVLLTKARRQLSLFDDASEEILVLDDVISARRAEEEAERTKMILDDLETHRAQYTPDEQCINIWRMVVSHIQSQSPATYQGFISHANLLSIDDGQVMVWVRSEYAADYLNSQGYGMLIGKLVARELGADYKSFTVQFVHPEGSATELLT